MSVNLSKRLLGKIFNILKSIFGNMFEN